MEAIFTADPRNGKLIFSNTEDLYKYCLEQEEVTQYVTMRPVGQLSDKQRLYAFLFGPLMAVAVRGFTEAGYEMVDKVKARYMLEAELCKAEIYNHKKQKTEVYIESVAGMSKARLLKFVVDACHFIESELHCTIPDSEAYKMMLKTGRTYVTITNDKTDK